MRPGNTDNFFLTDSVIQDNFNLKFAINFCSEANYEANEDVASWWGYFSHLESTLPSRQHITMHLVAFLTGCVWGRKQGDIGVGRWWR